MKDQPMAETSPAPYFAEIARGPDDGAAHWLTTRDGLRIRAGHWRPQSDAAGTILMFPGRTEYIEKYGPFATEMTARGFAVIAVDWRGQGLADRALADRRLGHVDRFADFHEDVAALLAHATALDLPKPWYMIGHSMGGAIGLRALHQGLPVSACVFTAPMWGIKMPAYQDTVSRILIRALNGFGQGELRAPGTVRHSYLLENGFAGNNLTTDLDTWAYMKKQVEQVPEFALAGPSIQWVREAIVECADLMRSAPRDLPIITALGGDETIVPRDPILHRMRTWPRGELISLSHARHEVLMEAPRHRDTFLTEMDRVFTATL